MKYNNDIQLTVREDGLTVVTKSLQSSRSRFMIAARVGSAYDPPNGEGFFHFFEHMAFKGTARRPSELLKAQLDRYCLYKNAFTAKLVTAYIGESVSRHRDTLYDLITDIFCNPAFPEHEIEKEKEVVLNEAAGNLDDDGYRAWFNLMGILYRNNPERRFSTGTPEGLAKINLASLRQEHSKWYVPSNTYVIATGDVDHKHILEHLNLAIPLQTSVYYPNKSFENEYEEKISTRLSVVERPERESASLAFGCKLPALISLSDTEEAALAVLVFMLGRGMRSLLWQEIRDKRGWVYGIGASTQFTAGLASYLYIPAGTLPARVNETVDLVPKIICSYPLTADHFTDAVARIQDQLLVFLENPESWMNFIQENMFEKGRTCEYTANVISRIQETLSRLRLFDVLLIRERLLKTEDIACAVVKSY